MIFQYNTIAYTSESHIHDKWSENDETKAKLKNEWTSSLI